MGGSGGGDPYTGEDAVSCIREQDEECNVWCEVEECDGTGVPYAAGEGVVGESGDRKH